MAQKIEPLAQKSKRRSPARSVELKARIIQAAASEFSAKGFVGTATRDIATRCGIGHPLLLYHFPSKDVLWLEVVKSVSHHFAETLGTTLREPDEADVVVKTREVLTQLVTFNVLYPEYHRLMLWEVDVASDEVAELVRTRVAPLLTQIARLIKKCQRQGRFASGDPYDLIYMLIGAASNCYLLGVEYELLTGTRPDRGQFMRKHVATCVNLFFRSEAATPGAQR